MKVDLHARGVMRGSYLATVRVKGVDPRSFPDLIVWEGRFFNRYSLIGENGRAVYGEMTAAVAEAGQAPRRNEE